MRQRLMGLVLAVAASAVWVSAQPAAAQTKGLAAIRTDEMAAAAKFLGAPAFRGRNTPSAEVEIAAE